MEENQNKPKIVSPIRSSNLNSKPANKPLLKPMTKLDRDLGAENKSVIKQEKVVKQASQPKNKKKIALVITIASILALILISVFVYFSFISPNLPIDISIEFETTLNINISTPTAKKAMPGDDIPCQYQISSSAEQIENNQDVFVRIRSYAIMENNYYSNVFSFVLTDRQQWHEGADGYYYLKTVLSPNNEPLDAVRMLHIKGSVGNEFAGKSVKVVFVAEALQADYRAIEEVWPTAPYEWSKLFR